MGKKLSTLYPKQGDGWCEIHLDGKEEMLYINFYNEWGVRIARQDFPDKSMHYVQDAAENWCSGIKKLEDL